MINIARTLLILGLVLGANATNNAEEETTTNPGWDDVAAGDSTTVVSGGDTAAATAAATAPKATAKVLFALSRDWSEDLADMTSGAAVALAGDITDDLDAAYANNENYISSVVTAFRQASAKRMRRTTPTTEADVEIYFSEAVSQAVVEGELTIFAGNSNLVTGTTVAEVEVSGDRFLAASALALILPVITRAL